MNLDDPALRIGHDVPSSNDYDGHMGRGFQIGDRVRFRVGEYSPIMTVAAVYPDHQYVDLEYVAGGEKRQLGIVMRALVLVDGAGRTEDEAWR